MKRIIVAFALLSVIHLSAEAQQDAQYSQYMFNSLAMNPGYAGYKEVINASLLHRTQWAGFDGAPKTQSLLVDGAFFNNKNVGLGLAIVNDEIGFQKQTSAYANYAYRLPVGENGARLAFGMALGIVQYSTDVSMAELRDFSDPNYIGGERNFTTPEGKVGLFYNTEKFYAGLSATNIISNSKNYLESGKNIVARQSRHYFLTAGYLVDVNEALKIKPSFLIREDTKGPTNLDLNTFFIFNEKVWLGAAYRTSMNFGNKSDLYGGTFKANALVGALQLIASEKFRVGYAYDYSLSDIRDVSNGSHEISIGISLNPKKGTVMPTPRYF